MTIKCKFTDSMTGGALRETDDGWAVQARVARGGNVQVYLGSEMGMEDRNTVRVYRPESEVFSRDAIATYARKPITMGHPDGGVTPETWADLAVGEIDRDVMRDGEFVSVPLLFRDAKAVQKMEDMDARELSMGYSAEINMEDGVSPSGEAYDAIMTDFKMNHVAVVPVARGGSELRIGDGASKWGAAPITVSDKKEDHMSDALKTVVLGDKAVQVAASDTGTVEAFKAEHTKAMADAKADHDKTVAAKDAEIATKDAEIEKLKKAQMSDADIDKLVADRADLIGKAKSIVSDFDAAGKSADDIRKGVVSAKLGDAAIADKSADYIAARFDILAEDAAETDPVALALKDAAPKKVESLDAAYSERNASLQDAWKQQTAKEA